MLVNAGKCQHGRCGTKNSTFQTSTGKGFDWLYTPPSNYGVAEDIQLWINQVIYGVEV